MEEINSNSNSNTPTQKLPNGTLVIILGIASIITCCCYGIISIILGGVALFLAKKDTALYNENPNVYKDYKNIQTGKILSIIGIILGVLYLIFMLWMISVIGWENMQDPEMVQVKMRELLGQ